jgi:hypothetical protein
VKEAPALLRLDFLRTKQIVPKRISATTPPTTLPAMIPVEEAPFPFGSPELLEVEIAGALSVCDMLVTVVEGDVAWIPALG